MSEAGSVRNLPLESKMTKRIKSSLDLPVVRAQPHLNAAEDYSRSRESTADVVSAV